MEKRKLKLNKQTLRNLSVLSDIRGGEVVVTFPDDPSAAPDCSHNSCTCKDCPEPNPPELTNFNIPDLSDRLTGLTILGGGGGGRLG